MAIIELDRDTVLGKIKPMHAVGQPPVQLGNNGVEDDLFHYLTEANIPYSRLHDARHQNVYDVLL